MILLYLWRWWYVQGWQEAAKALLGTIKRLSGVFSVDLLLRTLFSPWKQTVNVAGPNTSIQLRMKWWIGNQVSRFIGFIIRSSTLVVAALGLLIVSILGGGVLLVWPFVPVASVVLIIAGLLSVW